MFGDAAQNIQHVTTRSDKYNKFSWIKHARRHHMHKRDSEGHLSAMWHISMKI